MSQGLNQLTLQWLFLRLVVRLVLAKLDVGRLSKVELNDTESFDLPLGLGMVLLLDIDPFRLFGVLFRI